MKKEQYFNLEVQYLGDDQVVTMMMMLENPAEAFGIYMMLLLHLRIKDEYEASYSEPCLKAFCQRHQVRKEIVLQVLLDFGLFEINEEVQTFRSPYLDRVMEPLEKRWKANAENGKKGGRPKKIRKTPETPATTGEKPKLTKERKREEKNNTVTTVEYNSSNSIEEETTTAAAAVLNNRENELPPPIPSHRHSFGTRHSSKRFTSSPEVCFHPRAQSP